MLPKALRVGPQIHLRKHFMRDAARAMSADLNAQIKWFMDSDLDQKTKNAEIDNLNRRISLLNTPSADV